MGSKTSKKMSSGDKLLDFCRKSTHRFKPVRKSLLDNDLECREQSLFEDCERDFDETIEFKKLLRQEFARTNAAQFLELTVLCSECFREITNNGKQAIIGGLANLNSWHELSRKVPQIEFRPPKLYPDECQTLDHCVDQLNDTNSFGARLLWQLTAAEWPQLFGYPLLMRDHLLLQPFWTEINHVPAPPISTLDDLKFEYECVLEHRALDMLAKAAKLCYFTSTKNLGSSVKSAWQLQPYCGPNDDGSFQWGAKSAEFKPQSKLAKLLAQIFKAYCKGKDLPLDSIEQDLLKTLSLKEKTLRSYARRINLKLKKRVPLEISFCRPSNSFTMEYIGQDANPLFASHTA